MCFKKYREKRQLERQIRRLSEAERQMILQSSPYEIGWFQGEGFHIFLKAEPDFEKAYVDSLGEVSAVMAEDWVIRKFLLANRENAD
ncbi:hypothetical protein GCM10028805_31100 [Spirosoma harenae]